MRRKILLAIMLLIIPIVLLSLTIRGDVGNYKTPQEYMPLVKSSSPFETSHARGSFGQLQSFLQYRRFDLPKEIADFVSPDVGVYRGKFFFYSPPGVSFAAMPLYLLGEKYNLGQLFAYATECIFAIFNILLVYWIGRRILKLPTWASICSALIYGFTSTVWNYSITLYQHTFTAFFVLSIFSLIWLYKKSTHKIILGSLIMGLYAVSAFFDYTNVILLFPLVAYYLYSSIQFIEIKEKLRISFKLTMVISFLVAASIVGVLMWYNYVNLDSVFRTTNTLPRYTTETYDELEDQGLMDADPTNDQQATDKSVAYVFSENRIINGFITLTVGKDKGIFWFSPIFIFALFGAYLYRKQLDAEIAALLSIVAVNFLMYSSFIDPWGGWAFGPRYLIPSIPILALFVGKFLSVYGKSLAIRFLVLATAIYSSMFTLLGVISRNNIPPYPELMSSDIPGKIGLAFILEYYKKNLSPSFVYNTYFSSKISVAVYFSLMVVLTALVLFITIIILPRYLKDADND